MDCVRMRLSVFYWLRSWTNPYLLNQLMKARIDCRGLRPITSLIFLMGGSLPLRGGVFEVIQSLSDSLYRRVFEGTGSWSKESPGGSASQTLFGTETPLKIAPHTEERTPGDDFCEIIQRDDCATRTTIKRSQAIKC